MNRCTTCDATLAHDQRYCLQCGTRRGELPANVAAMIAVILERAGGNTAVRLRRPAADEAVAVGASADRRPPGPWLPTPRVAAVAVLGMLAFGAELGAVVGASGVATLANAPLVVLEPHAPAPATTAAAISAPPSSGGGSSAGGGGSSSGGGGSAASGGGASGGSRSGSPSPATTTNAITTTTTTTPTTPVNSNPYGLPSIQHVFVLMLADAGYSQTFGSTNKYLSQTLPKQGKLIEYYYGVTGGELANEIALISGQGPTQQTAAGCPTFTSITPAGKGKHGQVLGDGCVYPRATGTLGGQMTAAQLTWKAYVQGMATGTPGQPQACRHPVIGSADPNQAPQTGDPYVTWRNPFVYFRSVIDNAMCRHDDVDLTQLSTDLVSVKTTPNLSYIIPGPCDDGSGQPCVPGAASGVAAAVSFLRTVVPEIKASSAYQSGGLIAITFDQAPQSGPGADPSSCCATPQYPNLHAAPGTSTSPPPATVTTGTSTPTTTPPTAITPTTTTTTTTPTTTTPTTPNLGIGQGQTSPTGGGGQVGLLLISPWVKRGTIDPIDYYNHFSLLASIEDIFNLKHLGYAAQSGLPAFDAGTFDGPGPAGG
ncbi:MAG TPA: alkaline phosphatase family protein [Solirubrobacteraceae bacterium]|nr:alkaline phosphatase family protein [Solirubrobacteraceae bacterium]